MNLLLAKHQSLTLTDYDPNGLVFGALKKARLQTIAEYDVVMSEITGRLETASYVHQEMYTKPPKMLLIKDAEPAKTPNLDRPKPPNVDHPKPPRTNPKDLILPKDTHHTQVVVKNCFKCGSNQHAPIDCKQDHPFLEVAHPDINLDEHSEWKDSTAGFKYRTQFGAHHLYLHYDSGSTDAKWERKRTSREGDKTHPGGGRGRDHQGRGGGGRGGGGGARGGGRYGTFNTYGKGDKSKDQGGEKLTSAPS